VYPAIVALEDMLFREKGDETVRPEGSLFEQRSEAAITPKLKPHEASVDNSKSREEREAALRMRISTKGEALNLQNVLGFIN